MPVIEYGCSNCGLRKEKFFRTESPHEIECPACGAKAERLLSSFGFRFENGKVPGNSGVDSLDSDHDKAIGRDAQVRWEYIKDRNTQKRKVQREAAGKDGVGKVPLRMNAEGAYEPMPQNEVNRFKALHKEYDQVRTAYKKRQAGGNKSSDD